jgi:two-component system response regulator HydG
MAEGPVLEAGDLIFSPLESQSVIEAGAGLNLNVLEKNTIQRVIEKHNGSITRAAKELGITRAALYRRLNKYVI